MNALKQKLIIWGGTGQSIVLEEFLCEEYDILAIFDNNKNCGSPFDKVPVYYGMNELDDFLKDVHLEKIHFIVAIGGGHGKVRLNLHNELIRRGLIPISGIHPTSYIAKNATISEGCQVLANTTIAARVQLGKSCIINTASHVDHECKLGNGVHVGPGASIAGCVEIDNYSFIGTGATILPFIKIGKNCIIGAGSVITKNIADNSIVYGNPGKLK